MQRIVVFLKKNDVRDVQLVGCCNVCCFVDVGRFGLKDVGYSVTQARSPNVTCGVTGVK